MKTLDEVIKALECCQDVRCNDCPYKILFNDDSYVPCDQFEKEDDVLHYLREYRSEKAMWESDRKGYLDWIEQYKEAREKHQQAVIELKKNPPLTWDELKQMEGKPVWVEMPNSGYWIIIERFGLSKNDGTEYMETMQNRFWKENYGSWWKAYKREKK